MVVLSGNSFGECLRKCCIRDCCGGFCIRHLSGKGSDGILVGWGFEKRADVKFAGGFGCCGM